MVAELFITDGTTGINLINRRAGFHLQSWRPAVLQMIGGGTFQSSPLADGRRLVSRRRGNVIDTFNMVVNGPTQDATIRDVQELGRLLEKAVDYWTTDWQDEPVWIQARAKCEDNMRYATVHSWSVPELADPYSGAFISRLLGMDGFTLILEHGIWQADAPGEATCVEASGSQPGNYAIEESWFPEESLDDAYAGPGGVWVTAGWLEIGNTVGSMYAGVRFRNMNIPAGTTITGAHVRFQAQATVAAAVCNVTIDGEDIGDAPAFSTRAEFMARTHTAASTAWNAIGGWVINNFYNSPDITTAIQEIIDRGDWVSGNDLVVFFWDNASTGLAYRSAYTTDSPATTTPPELIVEYWSPTGHELGRSATCLDEVYVANKHNQANITHVHFHDSTGNVWSPNLMTVVPPTAFLPAVIAGGADPNADAVYFGIDTTLLDTGPFCSLVFDIGTIQNALTMVWEYWNGGWVALAVQDNTDAGGAMTGDAFDTAGAGSVHWEQPSDWLTTDPDPDPVGTGPLGTTGYWVRCRVSVAGGGASAPTQQNRYIYSIVWPYAEIQADAIGGDIPALLEIKFRNQSDRDGPLGNLPDLWINRAVVGLRSVERGEDFTAYINASDEQNPPGITFIPGGGCSIQPRTIAPTGRAQRSVPGIPLDTWLNRGTITLSPALAPQYHGQYHAFARVYQDGGNDGDLEYRIGVWSGHGDPMIASPTLTTSLANVDFHLADLGKVTLPASQLLRPMDITSIFTFSFQVRVRAIGATYLWLYDIILIPTDEWAGDFSDITDGATVSAVDHDRWLWTDSIRFPKHTIRAFAMEDDTNYVIATYKCLTSGPAILQANAHQRFWFVCERSDGTHFTSEPCIASSIQLLATQRYHAMRGNR